MKTFYSLLTLALCAVALADDSLCAHCGTFESVPAPPEKRLFQLSLANKVPQFFAQTSVGWSQTTCLDTACSQVGSTLQSSEDGILFARGADFTWILHQTVQNGVTSYYIKLSSGTWSASPHLGVEIYPKAMSAYGSFAILLIRSTDDKALLSLFGAGLTSTFVELTATEKKGETYDLVGMAESTDHPVWVVRIADDVFTVQCKTQYCANSDNSTLSKIYSGVNLQPGSVSIVQVNGLPVISVAQKLQNTVIISCTDNLCKNVVTKTVGNPSTGAAVIGKTPLDTIFLASVNPLHQLEISVFLDTWKTVTVKNLPASWDYVLQSIPGDFETRVVVLGTTANTTSAWVYTACGPYTLISYPSVVTAGGSVSVSGADFCAAQQHCYLQGVTNYITAGRMLSPKTFACDIPYDVMTGYYDVAVGSPASFAFAQLKVQGVPPTTSSTTPSTIVPPTVSPRPTSLLIRLSWLLNPADLDSHALIDRTCDINVRNKHCALGNGTFHTSLSGRGPTVTYIADPLGHQVQYYVGWAFGYPAWQVSGAVVEIFVDSVRLVQLVPTDDQTGSTWNVFVVTPEGVVVLDRHTKSV